MPGSVAYARAIRDPEKLLKAAAKMGRLGSSRAWREKSNSLEKIRTSAIESMSLEEKRRQRAAVRCEERFLPVALGCRIQEQRALAALVAAALEEADGAGLLQLCGRDFGRHG